MAKDPAFLFYPNDWLGGTMYLSRHQKGCYMDLLIAQFNIGPLSPETIKTVLGQDQATWTVLSSKFKQDSNGNFSNERLAAEIEKRKNFSESRRKNIQKRYDKSTLVDTSVTHMNIHMENRDRNRNKDSLKEGTGENFVKKPKPKVQIPFGENFKQVWEDWKIYKSEELKFKYKTTQSEQAAINSLMEVSNQVELTAIAIIRQSMAHGWKGFFELKNTNQNGTNQQTKQSVKNFDNIDYSAGDCNLNCVIS